MANFQWLRNFDIEPAYVSVNYQGRKTHQSRTGGCISIIFFLSVIFICYFKISGLYAAEKVIYESRIGKDSFDQLNLTDSNLSMIIKDKNKQPIPCNKISDHKLNILFKHQNITQNGQIISNKSTKMKPCSQSQSQIQFCVPSSENMIVEGRKDVVKYESNGENEIIYISSFSIVVQEQQSNLTQQQQSKTLKCEPIYPVVKFINHVINQEKKKIQEAIFDDQKRVFETNEALDPSSANRVTLQFTFQIKKVQMNTDYSVMPAFFTQKLAKYFDIHSIRTDTSWFYGQEFTTQSFPKSDNLFIANFKRSMYSNCYERHFARLDTVMAETFGLIGLLSMLLFCLYRGYNGWVLQRQNIGEQKSINILDYYKHQVKSFCYFISKHLISCLQFFKCYNGLKWIRNKLCCCLFREKQLKQRQQSFLKKRGLDDELDIYKSRRQINFLKKRVQILESALKKVGQHFSDVKSELDRSIRLSQGYQLTVSMINATNEQYSLIKDLNNQQNQLNENFIGRHK